MCRGLQFCEIIVRDPEPPLKLVEWHMITIREVKLVELGKSDTGGFLACCDGRFQRTRTDTAERRKQTKSRGA